jgi:membrane protein
MQAERIRRFALRLKAQVVRDRLSIVAAGVAFYALLAVFPGLGALIALYGLVFDAQQVGKQIAGLQGLLPPQALDLVVGELRDLGQANKGALGWSAAGGLLLALWSASRGIKILIEALNVAYDQREERGFLKRNALALLLTLIGIAGSGVAIATVVFLPAVVRFVGLEPQLKVLVTYVRWPILAATVAIGIAVMYRYGPSRERPGWGRVVRGALIATVLWLAASALFSMFVSSFGGFNRAYGSLTAVVILLMWFLLSAYAVLLGAEINAELERDAERPE